MYTPVIDFGHGGLVTIKGDPGTHLRLKARPAAATDEAAFGPVHEGAVDADGRVDLDVSPRVNTEYVVDYDGGGPGDTSADCPNGRAPSSLSAPC